MNAEGRNLLMGKFEPGPLELENSTVLTRLPPQSVEPLA